MPIILLGIAAASAWSVMSDIRSGKTRGRYGPEISRKEDPLGFWGIVAGRVFIAVVLVYEAITRHDI